MLILTNTKHTFCFNVNLRDYHFNVPAEDRADALMQLRQDLASIMMDINEKLEIEKANSRMLHLANENGGIHSEKENTDVQQEMP